MPELPEVETVMRGLSAVLTGRTIARAETRRAGLRWPFPENLTHALSGARVEGFRRRGKYMLLRLAKGDEGGLSVLVHLGMSGRMVARAPGEAPVPRDGPQGAASDVRGNGDGLAHEHLLLETTDGWRVGFQDPRRFGCVDLVPTGAEDSHRLLAGMGPEPLDDRFDARTLAASLMGKNTPIKAALLDQRVVAGLGNIYVAEALYRAGISPRRMACTVTGARAARLLPAIKGVLTEAIAAGGSSLRDYVRADGELGHFQDRFDVYDRPGQPCAKCPGSLACPGIARIVQAGRSTFFCPRTQR